MSVCKAERLTSSHTAPAIAPVWQAGVMNAAMHDTEAAELALRSSILHSGQMRTVLDRLPERMDAWPSLSRG